MNQQPTNQRTNHPTNQHHAVDSCWRGTVCKPTAAVPYTSHSCSTVHKPTAAVPYTSPQLQCRTQAHSCSTVRKPTAAVPYTSPQLQYHTKPTAAVPCHKNSSVVTIMSEMSAIYALSHCLFFNYFNIILPSMPRSSKQSFPSFLQRSAVYLPPPPVVSHALSMSFSCIWFAECDIARTAGDAAHHSAVCLSPLPDQAFLSAAYLYFPRNFPVVVLKCGG